MKKGDVVVVLNRTPKGKKIIEGKARLVRKLEWDEPDEERWNVEFLDEPGPTYERRVLKQEGVTQ